MDKKEIVARLVSLGVNNALQSYGELKNVAEAYVALPLNQIIDCWPHLTDQAKVKVVNAHLPELMRWVKEQE